jgi:translation initiation factor IF-1
VEFAYNRSVHGAKKFSPFEVVYGFNPCVPIDLVHIPIDERTYMDGIRMAELMKKLHKEVRLHIEEKTTKCAKQANKGQKMVRFEPGDLVWIHISKGRFPSKCKSKLMPRAEFRIIEKVNDNAYKVDLPGDYNVSATFNVFYLTPYLDDDDDDDSDLRTNHFQPGADDVHHGNYNPSCKAKSNMQEDSYGPMTRVRAKQLQRALTSQITMIEVVSELKTNNQFEIGSRMFILSTIGTWRWEKPLMVLLMLCYLNLG